MDKALELHQHRDFEKLEFYARQVVEGFITGMHKSPFHGFSVEFAEHRIYNPGESTRHIDWKLYGRTDRLYTKRYEEETNLRCHLVLDTSGSMFYPEERLWKVEQPNKFLFSAVSALSLLNLFKKQRDAVGLTLFGNSDFYSEARSTHQHHKIVNTELYKALSGYQRQQQAQKSMAQTLDEMALKMKRRSLVVIFSDLFELLNGTQAEAQKLEDAIKHLKFFKHEIILVWTTEEATELDFAFEDRPYKFVDMETGQSMRLNPVEVRKNYLKEMEVFRKRIKLLCTQYKIDFVEADVSKGHQQVLQAYLLKRRKMK